LSYAGLARQIADDEGITPEQQQKKTPQEANRRKEKQNKLKKQSEDCYVPLTPSHLPIVFTLQKRHREDRKPAQEGFPKSTPFVDWLPRQRGLLRKSQGIF
jgi:hypothetical protein